MPIQDNVSPNRLSAVLEQRIPELMAQKNVVGLSVALVQEAEGKSRPTVAWQRGFGLKDKATGEPVTHETVFQAASLSKPIFAYAVLKACAEGLLDLDTPLSDYLSEPYIPEDVRLPRIAARHVLSHTSGFPNWRPKDQPLRTHFPAGERFAYSGEGYVYLQRVIEHLSGQRLDAWMRVRLLDPLGMHRSSYVWIDAYETQAARGHDREGKPKEPRRERTPNAAYSLYTTPAEFARFVAVLLQPPANPACLSSDQVTHMLTPQVPVNDAAFDAQRPTSEVRNDENVSWGLGWGLQHTSGSEAFWHWGDNGDFQAFVMGFPRQKKGMVCAANNESGRELWAELFGLAFGAASQSTEHQATRRAERGAAATQPAVAWLLSVYGDGKKSAETSMMSIDDVAAYLRLHPLTVRKLAREGVIPAQKIGRQWRIDRPELERWISEQTQQNLASSER
jgi:excisionase family DNA binding protein